MSRLVLRKRIGLAIIRIPPLLTTIHMAGEEHAPRVELVAGGKLQRRARRGPDRVATVACRGPSLNPAYYEKRSSLLGIPCVCPEPVLVK